MANYMIATGLTFQSAYAISNHNALLADGEFRIAGQVQDQSSVSLAYANYRFDTLDDIFTMFSFGAGMGSTRSGPNEQLVDIGGPYGKLSATSDFARAFIQAHVARSIKSSGFCFDGGFAGRLEYLYRYHFEQTEERYSGDEVSPYRVDTTYTHTNQAVSTVAPTIEFFGEAGTDILRLCLNMWLSVPIGYHSNWGFGGTSIGLKIHW